LLQQIEDSLSISARPSWFRSFFVEFFVRAFPVVLTNERCQGTRDFLLSLAWG
jgi:hypothetical protein